MKNTLALIIFILSFSVWSQSQTADGSNGNRESGIDTSKLQPGQSRAAFECLQNQTKGTVNPSCTQLEKLANNLNGNLGDMPETARSIDGRFTCIKKAGFTADFKDCKQAINMYNGVVTADNLMQKQQAIRTNLTNQKLSATVSEQAASGDGQNATLDANIEQNKNLAGMYHEQEYLYGAAVAGLSKSLVSWQSSKKNGLVKICNGVESCDTLVQNNKSDVFANDQTRAAMAIAVSEYVQKGGAALKNAMGAKANADALAAMKNAAGEDPEDVMLDRCVVDPSAFGCETSDPAARSAGSFGSTGGGNFSLGGGGSNSFDLGSGTSSEFGDPGAATSGDGQVVASANSPFADAAKEASGILNPAAAATLSANKGTTSGSGSGGGVGGGMGGGSASLGGDLKGEDQAKGEPEIKSAKGGAYSSNGVAKFNAVQAGNDKDTNPFASLFDQKDGTGGGVEEDRDIASASNGEGSGLFQKISKRYSQVQADKRIEAINLE